jgi:hypothetical protein
MIMKKIIAILLVALSAITLQVQGQTFTQAIDSVYTNVNYIDATIKKLYPKHEIGFSVGAFPIIGIVLPPNTSLIPLTNPVGHFYYKEASDEKYEKMYHLGSFTFNYNYHFNTKHSLGVSLSWVGMHIDTYWVYYDWSLFGGSKPTDTVSGRGWKHHFTLQGNYRYTYYRKNNISLYCGVHCGITLYVRDKDILPKKQYFFGESNIRHYFAPSFHLNAFGIELGKKYVFNMELGIGTQGLLKTGFKYKF